MQLPINTMLDRADILIVDDRYDKHIAFRAILEDLGQNLISAASGEHAGITQYRPAPQG